MTGVVSATQKTGAEGEALAAGYLEKEGWTVLSRNWRTRRGEIDIIALEADTLVFIEVKTWPRGEAEDLELVIGYDGGHETGCQRAVGANEIELSASGRFSVSQSTGPRFSISIVS